MKLEGSKMIYTTDTQELYEYVVARLIEFETMHRV